MAALHDYKVSLRWADDSGTSSYNDYTRDDELSLPHKDAPLPGSASALFRGDKSRYSSIDLCVAAVTQSHLMRFLEVASQVGLVVVAYEDEAHAIVELGSRGDGVITGVTLRPHLKVLDGEHANEAAITRLHERAQSMSVVARSMAVPITVTQGMLEVVAA